MEGEKTGELLEQSLNKCRRFRGEAPAFFFSAVPSLAPLKCTADFTVGAVYDRAFGPLPCDSCAVIDRAYSKNDDVTPVVQNAWGRLIGNRTSNEKRGEKWAPRPILGRFNPHVLLS